MQSVAARVLENRPSAASVGVGFSVGVIGVDVIGVDVSGVIVIGVASGRSVRCRYDWCGRCDPVGWVSVTDLIGVGVMSVGVFVWPVLG